MRIFFPVLEMRAIKFLAPYSNLIIPDYYLTMRFQNTLKILTVVLVSSVSFSYANEDKVTFKQGKQSIIKKDRSQYKAQLAKLKNPSLKPYLEYYYYQENLKTLPPEEIQKFLQKNSSALFYGQLKNAFFKTLSDQKKYDYILSHGKNESSNYLKCIYYDALLKTKPNEMDWNAFTTLWKNQQTLPSTCKTVEQTWLKHTKEITLIDNRVAAHILGLRFNQAKALLNKLPEGKRAYYQSLLSVIQSPASQLMTQKKYYNHSSKYYALAIKQWGKKDSTHALRGLSFAQKNKLLSESDYRSLRNLLAVYQAGRSDAIEPLKRIASIPKAEQTDDIKISGFKLEAKRGNCKNALDYLSRLSEKSQSEPTWIYWKAKQYECLKENEKANALYQSIASDVSFYGFLAADKINQPYTTLAAITKDRLTTAEPLNLSDIKLAFALFEVDENGFARQAWSRGIKNASQAQKHSASLAAFNKGYYDLAIRAGVSAKQPGAVYLRYPIGYKDLVTKTAAQYQFPNEVIYGLIRQESLYQPDVKSHANAYGLMQLLIPTAQKMANKLGEKRGSLYDPEANIRYGMAYLDDVSDKVGKVWPYVLASYNAGPHRVLDWIDPPPEDMELWIETIPFKETRGYVKSILENVVIYHYQQGQRAKISDYIHQFYH